jgi:hypothetical protein
VWDEDTETWHLRPLELCGNRLRVLRPSSTLSPAYLNVPAARCAFTRQLADCDERRYRVDNLVDLELEMPQRTTERYTKKGSGGSSGSTRGLDLAAT